MNALLLQHEVEIQALCPRYHVRRLDLFGSAAAGERHADSDFDFLVEFGPLPQGGYADAYFGLREELEALLDAPVDLVVISAIRNPYSVERSRPAGRSFMRLDVDRGCRRSTEGIKAHRGSRVRKR